MFQLTVSTLGKPFQPFHGSINLQRFDKAPLEWHQLQLLAEWPQLLFLICRPIFLGSSPVT